MEYIGLVILGMGSLFIVSCIIAVIEVTLARRHATKAQAEISFRAGIREVVEWIKFGLPN